MAFKAFDLDGSGKISKEELKRVLGSNDKKKDYDYYESLIKEADSNGDGEIDYNEFVSMMSKWLIYFNSLMNISNDLTDIL